MVEAYDIHKNVVRSAKLPGVSKYSKFHPSMLFAEVEQIFLTIVESYDLFQMNIL